MYTYLIIEALSALIGTIVAVGFVMYLWKNKTLHPVFKNKEFYIPLVLFVIVFFVGMLANKTHAPKLAMPSFMHAHTPDHVSPALPFLSLIDFLKNKDRFEKVDTIGADPNEVPSQAQKPDIDGIVRIHLTAKEVIGEVVEGTYFNYWTYNGQAPGPMLRVTEGDTIELSITNDKTSLHDHNIDLHAVTGPGGGSTVTHVAPGETKTFRWKALNPGLFVYHCAMPNVSTHNSHGQYGLIMVDPKESELALSPVDKEFYIMQGELYTVGEIGKRGLVPFDSKALLDGNPNYVTFNGQIEKAPRMTAEVGDKIRMYVGNGGVNLTSSFHVIGEIFDTVYPEGSIGGSLGKNVQTTAVLPGGSSIVEFTVDVPGKYLLVDHALARMNKGAWAVLEVFGPEQSDVFQSVTQILEHLPVY